MGLWDAYMRSTHTGKPNCCFDCKVKYDMAQPIQEDEEEHG